MSLQTVKSIDGIRFSVWSPTEIRKYSVAEITAPETYDEDGMSVQGGLMDGRLGTLEPGQKCLTCGNTAARCPGHFGHIELAEPVLHIAFIDNIHKLLLSTCRSCARLKVPQDQLDAFQRVREKEAAYTVISQKRIPEQIIDKAKKAKDCPHCGKPQYEMIFTKPTIFVEKTEAGEHRLLPITIRDRFSRIPDDDLRLLNYDPVTARPEWFVMQALPVPPVTVRPSIILETGIRSEDDLTHKMVDIIRVNQRLKESKEAGTPPLIVQDLVDLLQYHTTTYFDNEVSGIPQAHHRSGRPLKTLTQRLKGKEGRFRGSLSGKRVDFSSRTVISPDPNLDLSEVGVPVSVATKLTIPEIVTEWNIERMRKLVINGPETFPGVNYIVRPDGVKIRLDYVEDRSTMAETIEIGYLVERHLSDGDIVMFNRQPSLHQMSIMAHYVKVLPGKTFRLHPSVCPPYNADFDGDEMNLHVPQSEEARAEAILLMRVQDQLISPRYGGPIIGALRDFVTGAYLLTKDDTLLTVQEFSNLAMLGGYEGDLPKPGAKGPDGPAYTGKQLFSLFLPKDFNYVLTSKWAKGTGGAQKDVVIKNGELISGVIDKTSIGAEEPESVLHRIAKDYGNAVGKRFLNSILIMVKQFITHYGFSYGFGDLEVPEKDRRQILDDIEETYGTVSDLIRQYEDGSLKLTRGMRPQEALEAYIVNELGKARDRAGSTANDSLDDSNAGKIMATTGARGSSLNVGQMAGALGQQSRRGNRLHEGYSNRALTHYQEHDNNPDAHGFVKSNYREGLSALEFFFHAMGGREGLVDTAVRTQQSGYMQRRLINALEHIRLEYDGTVRDPHGHIVQFLYGEDGIDVAKSDHGEAFNVDRQVESQKIVDSGAKATREEVDALAKKYTKTFNPRLTEMVTAALRGSGLSRAGVESVCKKGLMLYNKAKVEPGQAVGIITAQSIGEPGTQMTLRTFHFAGIKERNVTLGLPRLIELVDARKKPVTPTMDIYLDEASRSSRERAIEVARNVLQTRVSDLIDSADTDYSTWIRLALSPERLRDRGCTEADVEAALSSNKKFKMEVTGTLFNLALVEEGDTASVIGIRNKVLNATVKGVPDIERVTLVQKDDEWVIQTTGSNVARLLEVGGIDRKKVHTNNVFEIAGTLGIEAARNALISELNHTLEDQGLEVDNRYIMLVADLMCSRGYMQQIGRHGIAGTKDSVLARSAFEITVPTIAHAALGGEVERLKGITENVIVGSNIPIGSGTVDLYMQVSKKK
ncbi:MAG: DNA-directed RNA polymerase subunit A' [Nitrosopumilus sp.]|nr:DNA-directed RNA polymerase subunit A' [Nitrosopumilus sp.]CAI9832753.1 DNA-directed RNA polymerase subunit A'' [Nitrosopumilaceae archaeon]MDA7941843.1 DNA-directed RNA polymerase subunit A' [Nitrosopumilus sp.]MDA7943437.1 DNA-directed RNA polymerase subunit A' [Nitrosopumilus sp.]MDA7945388.1 DNA-directed RNA polymerase subunit A' [Nitrosopumilus sp.]